MTNPTVPTDAEIEAAYRKVWSTVPHAQRLTAFAHEIGATLAARWGAPAPASGEVMAWLVPLSDERKRRLNPYRLSRGSAAIWLSGFAAAEHAHGITAKEPK